jgi:hypothetical protein
MIYCICLLLLCILSPSESFMSPSNLIGLYSDSFSRKYWSTLLAESNKFNPTLDEVERLCRIDETISKLRSQIPILLVQALDKESVAEVYAESFSLLGPNQEELASGTEELVNLSTTIIAASLAAREANKLFSRSFPAGVSSRDESSTDEVQPLISSILLLDVSTFERILVRWKATIYVGVVGSSTVSGISLIVLNRDGLVSQHQLQEIQIDGQIVNAVGETLATLRRAFRSVQQPLLSMVASSFPILNELRDEIVQQQIQQQQHNNYSHIELPQLYATTSPTSWETFRATSSTVADNSLKNMTSYIPIDELDWPEPVPGSRSFAKQINSQRVITNFIKRSLPILSQGSPKEDIQSIFSPDCKMLGMDGSTLDQRGESISEFFRVLASIRQSGIGNWNVMGIETCFKNLTVLVEYVTNSPVRVEGRDRYTLSETGCIIQVEPLELVVRGIRVEDPLWYRQFYQAVQTGRNARGADVVLDWIEQVSSSGGLAKGGSDRLLLIPPRRSEASASAFYDILCTLLEDWTSMPTATAPAATYLSTNVELRGYFGETLLRGDVSYQAAFRVAMLSLRGAIRSGQVRIDTLPEKYEPTLIFRPDGCIRVDWKINLRLRPLPMGIDDASIPIKLQLISEYRVNQDGKISEHSIIETRINGQLTPGDVVARFWKGTTVREANPFSVQSILGTLNWARSLAGDS